MSLAKAVLRQQFERSGTGEHPIANGNDVIAAFLLLCVMRVL
jgi:hypothetical protein